MASGILRCNVTYPDPITISLVVEYDPEKPEDLFALNPGVIDTARRSEYIELDTGDDIFVVKNKIRY